MQFKEFNEYLNENNPKVEINMGEYGVMELELFPETAPITVENFLNLVDEKFYDGIIFHRVISGFMIQGGDPKGIGIGGSDKKIKGEFISNGVFGSFLTVLSFLPQICLLFMFLTILEDINYA